VSYQCECLAPIRCDLLQPVSTSRRSLVSQEAAELACIELALRSIESTLVPLWQRHIDIVLANIEVCWRSYLVDLVPWGVTGAVVIVCLPFVMRCRRGAAPDAQHEYGVARDRALEGRST
jgi:hypothetical protein